MLKLNRMTDYAVVALTAMAVEPDKIFATAQLAQQCGLRPPTIAKLMKQLAQAGVVVSHRGAHGGYTLARAPAETSVKTIITALEGPIALTSCVIGAEESCDVEGSCPMRGNWDHVNRAIQTALEEISLLIMMPPFLQSLARGRGPDLGGPAARA